MALLLSRQNLPVLDRDGSGCGRGLGAGGYVLWESAHRLDGQRAMARGADGRPWRGAARVAGERWVAAAPLASSS